MKRGRSKPKKKATISRKIPSKSSSQSKTPKSISSTEYNLRSGVKRCYQTYLSGQPSIKKEETKSTQPTKRRKVSVANKPRDKKANIVRRSTSTTIPITVNKVSTRSSATKKIKTQMSVKVSSNIGIIRRSQTTINTGLDTKPINLQEPISTRKWYQTRTSANLPVARNRRKVKGKNREEAKEKKQNKQKKLKILVKKFKKGVFNPDMEDLVVFDAERERKSNKLKDQGHSDINNRNAIRAVLTNNSTLLENCIKDKELVSSIYDSWGPELDFTSMDFALKYNNTKMLHLLLAKETRDMPRATRKSPMISTIRAGQVNFQAFGVHTRGIEMSRGNRQGNNAFMEKELNTEPFVEKTITRMLCNPMVEVETIKKLVLLDTTLEEQINYNIITAAQMGNIHITKYLINRLVKLDNYGFNELHNDVLSATTADDLTLKRIVSLGKRARGNDAVTPTHLACINPYPHIIKALISYGGDINITDTKNRKPVHFAAVCSNPALLEYLLGAGGNLNDLDKLKRSTLIYATRANRPDNIKYILQNAPGLKDLKDKKKMGAIHYACKYGYLECIKVLIGGGAKCKVGGTDGLPLLSFTAAYNHYSCTEYLVENKCRVLGKDKFKRSPLILGIRNGNIKIVSFLLKHGAEWNDGDSSNNSPLHYAVAYGWRDIGELLVKAGADKNGHNSWNITPLGVSMMLNQEGMLTWLLGLQGLNVNHKDDHGRTMLSQFMDYQITIPVLTQVQFILNKGADPNLCDLDGNSPLHYLLRSPLNILTNTCYSQNHYSTHEILDSRRKAISDREEMLNILFAGGINIKRNQQGESPLGLCITHQIFELAHLFVAEESLFDDYILLYSILGQIYNPHIFHLFKILVGGTYTGTGNAKSDKYQHIDISKINAVDHEGLTPLLYLVKNFLPQYEAEYSLINLYFKYQMETSEVDMDKNSTELEEVFGQVTYDEYHNFTYLSHQLAQLTKAQSDLLEKHTKIYCDSTVLNKYIELLGIFDDLGADFGVSVQKLLEYRDEASKEMVAMGDIGAKSTPVVREYSCEGMKNIWHYVVKYPHPKLLQFFDEGKVKLQDADFDVKDQDGYTPLRILVGSQYNFEYQTQMMEVLHKKCVDVNMQDNKGVTSLLSVLLRDNYHSGLYNDDKDDIFKLIKNILEEFNGEIDLSIVDNDYNYPLLVAVENNNVEITNLLVQNGANVNQTLGNLFDHPLLIAVKNNNLQITKQLLQNGAEANKKVDTSIDFLLERSQNIPRNLKLKQFLRRNELDPNYATVGRKRNYPLMASIRNRNDDITQKLLEYGANVEEIIETNINPEQIADLRKKSKELEELPDSKWEIEEDAFFPLLTAVSMNNLEISKILLSKGAQANMQILNKYSLHTSVWNNNLEITKLLLEEGAKTNEINKELRTPLHIAVSQTNALNYDTDILDLLLEYSSDINIIDKEGRSPLHYAFIKIDENIHISSNIDPIESVSIICNYGCVVDIRDNRGKSPLHYAAQRGSIMSSILLLSKGADLELPDYHSNTPLSLAFLYGHPQYALMLIEKGANIQVQVHSENGLLPVTMSLFRVAVKNGWQGLIYYLLSKNYDHMLCIQDAITQRQFKLVLKLLRRTPTDGSACKYNDKGQNLLHILGIYGTQAIHLNDIYNQLKVRGIKHFIRDSEGKTAIHYAAKSQNVEMVKFLINDKYSVNEKDLDGDTPIILSIRGSNISNSLNILKELGDAGGIINISYNEKYYSEQEYIQQNINKDLKLEEYLKNNPYITTPLIHAIRYTQNIDLIELLLRQGCDPYLQDNKQKDAFMYAAIHNNIQIFELLLKHRKYESKTINKDTEGKTALHYAAQTLNFDLILLLLENKYSINTKDSEGESPLVYLVRGGKIGNLSDIFDELCLLYQANFDLEYSENYYLEIKANKLNVKYKEFDRDIYILTHPYSTTPLIHAIRYFTRNLDSKTLLLIEKLLNNGANPCTTDSLKMDAFMYAAILNNTQLLNILLKFGDYNLIKDNIDANGKSVMHYAVQQFDFASYENKKLVTILIDAGFNSLLKDKDGVTPLDIVYGQSSKILFNLLVEHRICSADYIANIYMNMDQIDWEEVPDIDMDSRLYCEKMDEFTNQANVKKVKPDKIGEFAASFQVVTDEILGPYDAYLHKVNIKNGMYGEYLFYKMQLLLEENREVYVLFTRWGRIGEEGAMQRTPFGTLDEAIKEFRKIFKQKTRNNWEEKNTFTKVKGNYNLITLKNRTNFKDYLINFDHEKPKVESRLAPELKCLMEELTSLSIYNQCYQNYGINIKQLPLSKLSIQELRKAQDLLEELREVIKAQDLEAAKGFEANTDKMMEFKEILYELTSKYYELLPSEKFVETAPSVIDQMNMISVEELKIVNLINIEKAVKIFLSAAYRADDINPIDYCLKALSCRIDLLSSSSPEGKFIKKYIKKNIDNSNYNIMNIFKLCRKDELENIRSLNKQGRKRILLFHGSGASNFIGILSMGLQIAPPTAQLHGWAFGKGIYFADMFEKSVGYCSCYNRATNNIYMLICEIIVGKMKKVLDNNLGELGLENIDIIKAMGKRGPNENNSMRMVDGTEVLTGECIEYETKENKYIYLQNSEYIVFNPNQVRVRYLVQFNNQGRNMSQRYY